MKEEPKYTQPFWAKWMWWALVVLLAPVYWFVDSARNHGASWGNLWWLVGAAAGLVVFRYFQRKKLIRINSSLPRHPNNHYPDVCENCDPVCMKDGGPITNLYWWYAAEYRVTREQARLEIDELIYDTRAQLDRNYADYRNHPKFK